MAADGVDPEMRKALNELQEKMVDARTQLNITEMRQQGLRMDMQRLGLTAREVDGLPDVTPMYLSIGRM